VSDDPSYPGRKGLVSEAVVETGVAPGALAMLCGSPTMVRHTASRLRELDVPSPDIRFELFATLDEDGLRDPQRAPLVEEPMGSAR